MKQVSLCLTVYNRPDMIVEAFRDVVDDQRIREVIVSDDCSTEDNWARMALNLTAFEKVKRFRNAENHGVYDNKLFSVDHAASEYVVAFDSDNVMTKKYLDVVFAHEWRPDLILAPAFARPAFDYRAFCGIEFDRHNIKEWLDKPLFACMLNTMNYFVHRASYLDAWMPEPGISGWDSIWFNYLWLKGGGKILVVDGLEYDHRMHAGDSKECGSNFVNFAKESAPKCKETLELMRSMQNDAKVS